MFAARVIVRFILISPWFMVPLHDFTLTRTGGGPFGFQLLESVDHELDCY
jgi:hypothetical protein